MSDETTEDEADRYVEKIRLRQRIRTELESEMRKHPERDLNTLDWRDIVRKVLPSEKIRNNDVLQTLWALQREGFALRTKFVDKKLPTYRLYQRDQDGATR